MNFEKQNQIPETPEKEIKEFRDEIQKLKNAEMAKKEDKKYYNPHFDNIDAKYLGWREYEAYKLLRKGIKEIKEEGKIENTEEFIDKFIKLQKAVFNIYNVEFKNNNENPEYQTLNDFWAYLGNEFMALQGEKYFKKNRK
jgi:hypothetical protein